MPWVEGNDVALQVTTDKEGRNWHEIQLSRWEGSVSRPVAFSGRPVGSDSWGGMAAAGGARRQVLNMPLTNVLPVRRVPGEPGAPRARGRAIGGKK